MSLLNCPWCDSEYVYKNGLSLVCPECAYGWNPSNSAEEGDLVVLGSNDTYLIDRDSVTIVKNLKAKGVLKDPKQGTRVKNIRLVGDDHNIDCKVDGFDVMKLKLEFVKKL